MSLESVPYVATVEYDQLWRDSERQHHGMPATMRPVGPDGSVVELCHGSSRSNVYNAVKQAGQVLLPPFQEHTVAMTGLKQAKAYFESIDELDTASRVGSVIGKADEIRRDAIAKRLGNLNRSIKLRPDFWVVFKAGEIGCFYAGRLVSIDTVGDDLNPLSLPLIAGADDVPGRLPPDARSQALYREATNDAAQDQPESQSV